MTAAGQVGNDGTVSVCEDGTRQDVGGERDSDFTRLWLQTIQHYNTCFLPESCMMLNAPGHR